MKKILAILILLLVLTSCSSTAETTEKTYTLTSEEQNTVQVIYNNRSIWEKDPTGSNCTSIRYVEKNGYKFLVAGYSKGSSVSMEKKYTVTNNSMYEARADEYGYGADVGLVTGLVSYNCSSSTDDKYTAISKAVSGKSNVILP